MLNKVMQLREAGVLAEVRLRLGAENSADTSKDHIIETMDSSELVGAVAGWQLGNEEHWFRYKRVFDKLEELNKE